MYNEYLFYILAVMIGIISGEDQLVPVIDVSIDNSIESSGSGDTDALMNNTITSMLTSGADIADFTELSSESVGQLYAYRYSNTSVVLGTRSASGLIGDSNEVVQMAIGLSAVADGMYVCVAENFPHRTLSGISDITVNITTTTRKSYTHVHLFVIPSSQWTSSHTIHCIFSAFVLACSCIVSGPQSAFLVVYVCV